MTRIPELKLTLVSADFTDTPSECQWTSQHYPGTPHVDIVAIHGLGGHPTWFSSKGETDAVKDTETHSWIHDWLPDDFPTSRIYTYGYPPSAFRSSSVIADVAEHLLIELGKVRSTQEVKPLHLLPQSLPLKSLETRTDPLLVP